MSIQYGLISPHQIHAFLPLLSGEQQILNNPGVFSVGAIKDNQACGILVFQADEVMADILHLAVAEPFRHQGIANGLIDFLCKSAWETGTVVLCSFSAVNRDDPLCRLFTKRGDFTLTETEDYICRFPCKNLASVDLKDVQSAKSRAERFYKLPQNIQYSFFSNLKEDNAEFARGLMENQHQMLEPLCLCTVEKGSVQAAIFCQSQGNDVLLAFVYTHPNHVRSLIALTAHLQDLLLKAADKVDYLQIAAVTPQSRKLVNTLLPQREVIRKFYTACWDMNTMGG